MGLLMLVGMEIKVFRRTDVTGNLSIIRKKKINNLFFVNTFNLHLEKIIFTLVLLRQIPPLVLKNA